MLDIDRNQCINSYMVTYSRLQQVFALVDIATGHILKSDNMFAVVYDRIKILKKKGAINIHFTDSAIDELTKRGFEREEIPQLLGGV